MREIRIIYALYDRDEYRGDYTAKEIGEICGINGSRVNSIADKGKLVDERYRIEAVDIVVKWDNDLADIWDQRRLKILKG